MSIQDMISANDFCKHHQIDISFLYTLQDYGLVEITNIENNIYLQPDQMDELEKIVRLHYDLHINLEGIDAITHLLQQLHDTQSELIQLRNRLQQYSQDQKTTE
jgi:chaperone modulatory protein CbpM